LLDQQERVLLLRGERPENGRAFWFPAGGRLEEGEDARAAAVREVAEETGLTDVPLGPEIWHRRHVFTWRGEEWDQRERWFIARVAHFEPSMVGMTEAEKAEISACRWWSLDEMDTTLDELVPRDLVGRTRQLLAEGPPSSPIDIGT
jgi:ADP-ribose pyrophosphatase YjhB (NUDIX family)